MKKTFFATILCLFSLNPIYASADMEKPLSDKGSTINNIHNLKLNQNQINWLDKYLESIILDLIIKKIDFKLSVFQLLKENNTNKIETLFLSDIIQLKEDADCLKIYKNHLEDELVKLKYQIINENTLKLAIPNNNDFDIDKMIQNKNFYLKDDDLQMVNTIKMYQNILKENEKTIKILSDEIKDNKRSALDIHFTIINKLENQIFLKKFFKIYLIEKLKQHPNQKNLNEINSFLTTKLNTNFFKN